MFAYIDNFFDTLTTKKAIIILSILCFVVFFNGLFNGFVGDDFDQIINNPSIHSISNLPHLFSQGTFYDESGQSNNYYKPLLSTIFSIIYSIFGVNAFPFHLIQICIHLANSILIFLLLRYFFKKNVAFTISLLFLLHPINTEAVVYISALQENLFLFFGLTSFYIIIKKQNNTFSFLLTSILLLCSLLAKETGILFLLLIPVFQFFYNRKKLIKTIIQCIGVFLIYLFFRLELAHIGFSNQIPIAPIQTLSLGERIVNIPEIIFFYLKTFFFPINLLVLQTWIVKQINIHSFYLPLVIDLLFFILLIVSGLIISKKYHDYFKHFLFFFIWFVIGLGMIIQVFPLDETVADRWFYFPIIGLLGMGGIIIEYVYEKKYISQKIVLGIFLFIIFLFSLRIIIRNTNWNNNTTLYLHDIKNNKNSYQLEIGLGNIASVQGNFREAETDFITSTIIFPSHITYGNLGNFYLQNNYASKAVVAYTKGLMYYNKNAISWVYLGMAKYNAGDKKGAMADIKKAYEMQNNSSFLIILQTIENGEPITFQKQ